MNYFFQRNHMVIEVYTEEASKVRLSTSWRYTSLPSAVCLLLMESPLFDTNSGTPNFRVKQYFLIL